jgi:hypothetical protein
MGEAIIKMPWKNILVGMKECSGFLSFFRDKCTLPWACKKATDEEKQKVWKIMLLKLMWECIGSWWRTLTIIIK